MVNSFSLRGNRGAAQGLPGTDPRGHSGGTAVCGGQRGQLGDYGTGPGPRLRVPLPWPGVHDGTRFLPVGKAGAFGCAPPSSRGKTGL